MNTQFTINFRAVQRITCVMVAALLFVAALPWLQGGMASAQQFSNRSIQLSDSSPSGTSITSGVGSGTGVTYQVSFTPTNQAASMVIDFCSEDPIINDTCTRPTGMAGGTSIASVTGTVGGTGWTLTAANGQIKLADDGTSSHDIQAAAPQVFTISGITNPSTVGTFYARMYTYTNTTWGTYGGPDTVNPNTGVGNFVDYGGVALSTVPAITITARVQESLTFCISKANPATDWGSTHFCDDPNVVGTAGANLPALTLGHGSGTKVLEVGTVDTGSIYSQLSTNATHGAVINLRNSNTSCGGLSADSGTTCAIPPIGSGSSATPSAMASGTAAFGLFVSNGSADPGGTSASVGSTTASTVYNDGTHNTTGNYYYNMDTSSSASTPSNGVPSTYTGSVTSTFGSTLAYTTAPCYRVDNTYVFAATPALTTPAGIYTANMSMIATGTF
jgi:hypothetical protein